MSHMKHADSVAGADTISEMDIVDTFTKLIFGDDSRYSRDELQIIQAFRMVDTNVVFDSHRDMGAYLRALGVREMIQLVKRVRQQVERGAGVPAELAAAPSLPSGRRLI